LRGDPGRYDRQPIIAASLTSGGNHASKPGRRMEDDFNIVAFESRVARNGRGAPSDVVPPLKAQSGETGKGDGAPMVAFDAYNHTETGDHTVPLRDGHSAGVPTVAASSAVRRLTPVECEALQGFPADWTQLGDTPDGKRYHALGDAVTVNVAEFIGRRLMAYGFEPSDSEC
jgi:site-specific DNA-cytosine methylase